MQLDLNCHTHSLPRVAPAIIIAIRFVGLMWLSEVRFSHVIPIYFPQRPESSRSLSITLPLARTTLHLARKLPLIPILIPDVNRANRHSDTDMAAPCSLAPTTDCVCHLTTQSAPQNNSRNSHMKGELLWQSCVFSVKTSFPFQ